MWSLVSTWISARLGSAGNMVFLVVDGQGSTPSQANVTYRLIPDRKPKSSKLLIFVTNFVLLRPERRVLRRLGLDAGYGKVASIHPHFSTMDVLAFRFRSHPQHILEASFRWFVAQQFKVVIIAIQLGAAADCRLCGLFLAFQEPLEDAILNQLRATLRNDAEVLGGGAIIGGLHDHLGFPVAWKSVINEPVDSRRFRMQESLRAFLIVADKVVHDLVHGKRRVRSRRRKSSRVHPKEHWRSNQRRESKDCANCPQNCHLAKPESVVEQPRSGPEGNQQ